MYSKDTGHLKTASSKILRVTSLSRTHFCMPAALCQGKSLSPNPLPEKGLLQGSGTHSLHHGSTQVPVNRHTESGEKAPFHPGHHLFLFFIFILCNSLLQPGPVLFYMPCAPRQTSETGHYSMGWTDLTAMDQKPSHWLHGARRWCWGSYLTFQVSVFPSVTGRVMGCGYLPPRIFLKMHLRL